MRYVRLDDLLRNDLIRFVVQKHPCLRFLSRFVFQAKRLTLIICHKIAELAVLSFETRMALRTTVRPVLSGHRIKRTPFIKRTVAEVPKFVSLIYFE